jgi:hypothetical protein
VGHDQTTAKALTVNALEINGHSKSAKSSQANVVNVVCHARHLLSSELIYNFILLLLNSSMAVS